MLGGERKRQPLSLAAKLEIISKLEEFYIFLSYGQIQLTGTLRSQRARIREVRVYIPTFYCQNVRSLMYACFTAGERFNIRLWEKRLNVRSFGYPAFQDFAQAGGRGELYQVSKFKKGTSMHIRNRKIILNTFLDFNSLIVWLVWDYRT